MELLYTLYNVGIFHGRLPQRLRDHYQTGKITPSTYVFPSLASDTMSDDTPVSPITGRPRPRSENYEGGCHCGAVSYTVKLSPPLSEGVVSQCNCSICHINGQLMVYPLESQITWHSGKDSMTGYTFGPAKIMHFFCPTCGTSLGGKSTEGVFANNRAVNVRTLRGVDIESLKLRKLDGRNGMTNKEYHYDDSKHPQNGYGSRIV